MRGGKQFVMSMTVWVVMFLSGCGSASRSAYTRDFVEGLINDNTMVLLASGKREIRLVMFLKSRNFTIGKRGFEWFPDTDDVKGAYCLQDGSVIAFEFSLKGEEIEICGARYDLKRGRVFLAESKTKIDQLSVNLKPLPPPGVAYRLRDEADRLAQENLAVKAFVEKGPG